MLTNTGDLARTTEIEGWDPQRAAEEYDLPVEAVLEAQQYLHQARDLVLAEELENRLAAGNPATAATTSP